MSTKHGMSGELEDVFDTLSKRVWQLRYDWVTFGTLYMDKSRVEMLNNLAPAYFGMDQGRFTDHLKLSIARLFDPEYSGRNPSNTNLTLYAIIDLMRQDSVDTAFVDGVKVRIDRLKTDLQPVINERHKRIAHLDRATALGNNALGSITRDQFTSALDELEKIIDDVDDELRDLRTEFSEIRIQAGADATQLVRLLEEVSVLTERERLELWGKFRAQNDSTETP